MNKRILIIGGYGNFGRFITSELSKESDLVLFVGGRNPNKAHTVLQSIQNSAAINFVYLDIYANLASVLAEIKPVLVIHTSGPYQSQSYFVAKACIENGCHYVDLADAREFVCGISALDKAARKAKVLVTSGASSVPTLTSAIIDAHIDEFEELQHIEYAISSAQLTNQGLATTQAILSYAGIGFTRLDEGKHSTVYGWQGLRVRPLWGMNTRLLGHCNIPDLGLFPLRYQSLQSMLFQAGIESKVQHFGLYLLTWLVRLKLVSNLQPAGKWLLKISRWFDVIGSNNSGFYMLMRGRDKVHTKKSLLFEIVAREGDGLYIPCIPAILMAKKLARSEISDVGALPCMGFINLPQYLDALKDLDIRWRVTQSN